MVINEENLTRILAWQLAKCVKIPSDFLDPKVLHTNILVLSPCTNVTSVFPLYKHIVSPNHADILGRLASGSRL